MTVYVNSRDEVFDFDIEFTKTLYEIGPFFIPWEERETFEECSENYLLREGVSQRDAVRVLVEDDMEAFKHDAYPNLNEGLYEWACRHPELFADI